MIITAVLVDGAVQLDVDAEGAPVTRVRIERSIDGGASWDAVAGGADVPLTAGQATLADTMYPEDLDLTYRAVALEVVEDFEDAVFAFPIGDGGSDAPWARDDTEAFAGSWSLRSGAITHDQTSEAAVTLPAGAVSAGYALMTSTESTYDPLIVYVDGAEVERISGEQPWGTNTVDVTGATLLRFTYQRDVSDDGGSNAAWIDSLTVAGVLTDWQAMTTVPAVPSVLGAAIAAGDRTVLVRVGVDWDGTGITWGPDSISDLSGRVGAISIERSLTGDLPDQVRVVEGSAAASASLDLVVGDTDDDRRAAAWYFSRFNSESPLAGLERLRRPIVIDVGFRTESGVVWTRLFTGRTRSLPVDAGARTASLEALDNRELLRTPVQLPSAVAAMPYDDPLIRPGLEPTWAISNILYQSGIPLAPPPRPNTRAYIPMHGSAWPFIPDADDQFAVSTSSRIAVSLAALVELPATIRTMQYTADGPFSLAADVPADHAAYVNAPLGPGPNASVVGWARARVGGWFKLSEFDTGQVYVLAMEMTATNAETGSIAITGVYVTPLTTSTAQLSLRDNEGQSWTTIATGPTITASDDWQYIGVEWDLSQPVIRWRTGGSTTSTMPGSQGIVWPDAEVSAYLSMAVAGPAAAAELIALTGPQLSTTPPPWGDEEAVGWVAGAVVDRSATRLQGIVPSTADDAWGALAEIAAAELAVVRADELGVIRYETAARLAGMRAQNTRTVLDADTSIIDLAYEDSIDQIRNVVTATSTDITVNVDGEVWSADTAVRVPPRGRTTITVDLDSQIILLRAVTFTAYPSSTGGGTEAGAQIRTSVAVAGARMTITFRSVSANSLWLIDSDGTPNLIVTGDWIESSSGDPQTSRDEASIAEFEAQPLSLDASPWRQDPADAGGVAALVLGDTARPRPTLTDIGIVADPRLRLGDRVRVRDRHGLVLDGDYWITAIKHDITADGGYTMTISARPARSTALWDQPEAWWDEPDLMWSA